MSAQENAGPPPISLTPSEGGLGAAQPWGHSAPGRLAQLEVLEPDGRVLHAHDVRAWPLRLGRALDNDIVLHDATVAAHHALVVLTEEGELQIQPLPSRNGAQLEQGRHRLALNHPQTLPPLACWWLGHTRLRLRLPQDPLSEEALAVPHGLLRGAPAWQLAALLLAVMAWMAGGLWLGNAPDAGWDDYLPQLLSVPAVFCAWAVGWGLASKLFTRRFSFVPHLKAAMLAFLAGSGLEALLPALGFALDLPVLGALRHVAVSAVAAALVAYQLSLVLPFSLRRLGVAVATLWVLGHGVATAVSWQHSERLFEDLYATSLYPPSWRLAGTRPAADLAQQLKPLEQALQESARRARAKELGEQAD